jgi:hypothetical protein
MVMVRVRSANETVLERIVAPVGDEFALSADMVFLLSELVDLNMGFLRDGLKINLH